MEHSKLFNQFMKNFLFSLKFFFFKNGESNEQFSIVKTNDYTKILKFLYVNEIVKKHFLGYALNDVMREENQNIEENIQK
jgi:hypothetical protein